MIDFQITTNQLFKMNESKIRFNFENFIKKSKQNINIKFKIEIFKSLGLKCCKNEFINQ